MTLTVLILALNEERNIADCLASVSWASQILVVDSGSTDRTVELAEQHGATVRRLPWEGYGKTKNKALEEATGDWVLWLDADERVTPELGKEIQEVIAGGSSGTVAFDVARRAFFLGKWIRYSGWYPGRVTRLFRRGKATFTEDQVHEGLSVRGKTASLSGDLIHLTDPDLTHYFSKFNRYTSLAVEDLLRKGVRPGTMQLIIRPFFTFFRMYFMRQGWRDGKHGFVLAVLSATYVFTKYAKLWEHQLTSSERG